MKNEYGVKMLVLMPQFMVICPISQGPLTIDARIEFQPGEEVPEFMEFNNWIRHELNNRKFTVEGVAGKLAAHLQTLKPKGIRIQLKTSNNNTYFPVEVVLERGEGESEPELDFNEGAPSEKKGKGKKKGY